MYSLSRAGKHKKYVTFQNEVSTVWSRKLYEPPLLSVKMSESCILFIQFYVGSTFCVINTMFAP